MITTEEILNMNFYKKEKFTGSYLGMRYLIKKDVIETPVEDGKEGEVNKTDIFRAYGMARSIRLLCRCRGG